MVVDSNQTESVEDLRAMRAARAAHASRIRIAVCVAFVVVALAAFVGVAAASGVFDATVAPTGQAATGDVAFQTVVDSEGRTVKVPAEPKSIAIMDPFSGELAVMVGAGPQLCGVPGGVISDSILQSIYPELSTSPVTLSGNSVNIETLAQMSCDVAIVKGTLSDAERKKLDRQGIPYVVVGYTTVDEQISATRLVGQVCGGQAAQQADSLADYYQQTVADVERREALVPDSQRIRVYHSINDILLTDASGSLGQDWIERVGCTDVSSGSASTSGTDYDATLEQVYAWNPDMVICNVAATAQQVKQSAQWAGLPAVAQGKVLNIPIGATRWGQRGSVETYLAMLWLGCQAYPDQYSDVDLKQTVVDYYRTYLGVEVDDALYEQILSGEGIRSSGNNSDNGGSGSGSGSGSGNGTGGGTGGGGGGA